MTPTSTQRISTFASRVRRKERVLGLFVRLADPVAIEALAGTCLDFVILDVENSSLNRHEVDALIATARACDLPIIVRIAAEPLAQLQQVMMSGATGVIASHVRDEDSLRTVVEFARGSAIAKAYAGVARGTRFRTLPWLDFHRAMQEFLLFAQVDSPSLVDRAQAMAAVPALDGLFVGSLTLALELGVDRVGAPAAAAAVARVVQACETSGIRLAMHATGDATPPTATVLVVGNELNALRQGVGAMLAAHGADKPHP